MAIDLAKMRRRNTDGGGMRTVWDNGSTHYSGCEYDHYGCAVEALCKEVDELRKNSKDVGQVQNGWIGVDLDGTLSQTIDWSQGCGVGAPIPAMVERVKGWLDEGKDVRIFTARVGVTGEFSSTSNRFADEAFRDEQIVLIEAWCVEHIGTVLPITSQKDFKLSRLYDDRCIQVEMNTGRLIDAEQE